MLCQLHTICTNIYKHKIIQPISIIAAYMLQLTPIAITAALTKGT